MTNYNIQNLQGKEIQLFPNDTYNKIGKIIYSNIVYFIIEITHADQKSNYVKGDILFFPINKIIFKIIGDVKN